MYMGTVKSLHGDNFSGYCAIDDSDILHCWGNDMPDVPADLGPVKEVSIAGFPCAIDMNSQLRCWGQDEEGNKPHLPEEVKTAKSVSSNYWGTICAINLEREAYCWIATGYGTGEYQVTKLPAKFNNYERIIAGDSQRESCLVSSSGKVDCTGRGYFSMVGPKTPFLVIDYDESASIGCSINLEGKVECFGWGSDAHCSPAGCTGHYDGTATEYEDAIPAILGKARDVSVGRVNACAVDEIGKISCWSLCKASNCHSNGLSTPTTEKVLKVVTGIENGCAILENRKVTCW